MSVRDELEPIETASRDTLRTLQLQRLKNTLQLAYERIPHYRQKFDAAGVHPGDLKELSDLAKFPFTTKDDLRQNYPFGMFAVPMADIVRIHASSGTTGKPTVVGYTRGDIETWSRLMARSIRAAGGRSDRQDPRRLRLRPVHRRARLPLRRRISRRRRHPGRRRLYRAAGAAHRRFQARHHRGDAVLHARDRRRIRAAGLRRRATAACASAFSAPSRGPKACAPKSSAAWASQALDHLRPVGGDRARRRRRNVVETKDGLTIWEDHFFPEIIDPEIGASLPDGEAGELVLTSLTKEAMPVIRYRTRDLTRLLPARRAPCGASSASKAAATTC